MMRAMDAAVIAQVPVDLGFRQSGSHEKEPQPRLARRSDAVARLRERTPQQSVSDVAHDLDLVPELHQRRPLRRIERERVGRRDQIVEEPQRAALTPRARRILDAQAVRCRADRRLTGLKSVPEDAAGPGFATGTVRRDVDSGPVRPSRHRVSIERERGLVAEELVLSHSRRVGAAALAHLCIGRHGVPSANAVKRAPEVATSQPTVTESDLGCARHAERRGKRGRELVGTELAR